MSNIHPSIRWCTLALALLLLVARPDQAGAADPAPAAAAATAEKEPNNRWSDATEVAPDARVTAPILPKGDRDLFRVRVDRQGELKVALTNSPAKLSLWIEVYNSDYSRVAGAFYAVRPGAENDAVADLPDAGYYWIQVGDQYDGGDSPDPYQLKLTFTPTGDVFEPNPSAARARSIPTDGKVLGALLPAGDKDWYRLDVDRQGLLQVGVKQPPKNLEIWMEIYDANLRMIGGTFYAQRKGAETLGEAELAEQGTYYIHVGDRNYGERSPLPYTLETAFTPTADGYEPNPSIGTARPIPAGVAVQGAILPRTDRDWYRLAVDKPGKLDIALTSVPANLALWIEVWDANNARIAGPFYAVRDGAENRADMTLPAAGWYAIHVGTRDDAKSSPASYTLTTKFTPAP